MATVGVKWLTACRSLFVWGFTFVQQIDRTISSSVWPTFRRWRRHLRCGTTPSVVSTRAGSRMELLSTWTVPVTRLRPDTSYSSFQATTSPISVSCKYSCEVTPPIVSNSTAEPLIRRVLTWTTSDQARARPKKSTMYWFQWTTRFDQTRYISQKQVATRPVGRCDMQP